MERGAEATHLEQRGPGGSRLDGDRAVFLDGAVLEVGDRCFELLEGRPDASVRARVLCRRADRILPLGLGHRSSRGSRASRRPSPSRLKARTESVNAMPGKKSRWGAENT